METGVSLKSHYCKWTAGEKKRPTIGLPQSKRSRRVRGTLRKTPIVMVINLLDWTQEIKVRFSIGVLKGFFPYYLGKKNYHVKCVARNCTSRAEYKDQKAVYRRCSFTALLVPHTPGAGWRYWRNPFHRHLPEVGGTSPGAIFFFFHHCTRPHIFFFFFWRI